MRQSRTHRTFAGALVAALLLGSAPLPAYAQEQSFSDVPSDHWAYDAVEYLKTQGIISGYPDGTFQPDKKVNRAEAVKIIVAPLVTTEALQAIGSSPFDDVPMDTWFRPYVEHARQTLAFIDSPPKKPSFLPAKPVLKVEFLKMLLLANKEDPVGAFSEIRLPLADDVTNPDEWYYSYVRFALTASMLMFNTETGTFNPARELNRGEVALVLYRYMMYKQGRRTQALLSQAEQEIIVVLNSLEQNNIVQAEYASARGLLAARGAHARQPDIPLVQGAVKIAEAFRALVRGYRAGVDQKFEDVVTIAGEAWQLAERAKELTPDLSTVSDQIKNIAKNMANSARSILGVEQ